MKGFLDKVTPQVVAGWAYDEAKDDPVRVSLLINDKTVAVMEASQFRPGMLEMHLHPTGRCGFYFDLQELGIELPQTCVVRVTAGKKRKDLWNSPWPYRHIDTLAMDWVPMSRKRLPGRQFFFIHIPKTAGSSFGEMITDLYPAKHVFANRADRKRYGNYFPSHNEYLSLSPRKLEDMQLMMGHIPFCLGQMLPRLVQYLVFFRDPRERVLSNLFYLHQNFPLYRGQTIEQIFHLCKEHHFKNLQVRYFADQSPWDLEYFRQLKPLDEEALDIARQNLDQCQFIGLTEEFDASIELANKVFGWELTSKHLNKTSRKDLNQLPEAIIEELEDLIRFDIEFYTYARERYALLRQQVSPAMM